MSDSQWRIDLAREIAKHYDAQVIILTGSPALAAAHAYSDLDIVMYWDGILPDDTKRLAIPESFGGTITEFDALNAEDEFSMQCVSEVFYLETLKVDVTHVTLQAKEAMISEVTEELDTSRAKMTLLNSLDRALVLKGEDIAEKWFKQLNPMPDALIEKMLPTYLHLWAYQPLQKLAVERDDALYARQLIDQTCEKLFVALCLLNRRYPPYRMKHLVYLVTALEHKPANFIERIHEICNTSTEAALLISKSLVEDTFDLAESLGYDISAARTHYQTGRPATYEPIKVKEKRL